MTQTLKWLIVGAIAWSVLLIPLAVVLPVESSDSIYSQVGGWYYHQKVPLVRLHGYRVLLLVAVPLAISLLVSISLAVRWSKDWRLLRLVAWLLSLALFAAGLVGAVTILIGVFVLPAGGLLLFACAQVGKLSRSVVADNNDQKPVN
jgi:hypothetical protein